MNIKKKSVLYIRFWFDIKLFIAVHILQNIVNIIYYTMHHIKSSFYIPI